MLLAGCVLDSVPPPLADLSTIYHQTVANSGLVTAGARLQRILELETNIKRKVLHDYEHMDLRVDLGLKLYLRVVNTGGLCDIVPVYPGEHAAAAPVARCRRGGRRENRMD